MQCLTTITGRGWTQESYESASGNARRRASQLRKLGYQVLVHNLGPQITPVGRIRLSMVDIRSGIHEDTTGIPPVNSKW